MIVSKELLERYHLNNCSVEECRVIEEWLFNNEVEELRLPENTDKAFIKLEMWKEISTNLPPDSKVNLIKSPSFYMWKGAVAASLFLLISVAIGYFFLSSQPEVVDLNNSSASHVREVSTGSYTISVGPNTVASINNQMNILDLTGSLLISAKKDVKFAFEGTNKEVSIEKGQTYLLLKTKDGTKEIIIVNTQNLFDLSPVMQRQITAHFDI